MNISRNTFWQDSWLAARCIWGLSEAEEQQFQARFRNRYLIRLCFLPVEELVRYTRIFISAFICWTMQQVGATRQVRYWKYHTNQKIISLARCSLSLTICQAGWGSGRGGILLSILAKRGFQMLYEENLRQHGIGYRDVEQQGASPIVVSAFFRAQKLRVNRIRNYVKVVLAGLMYWMATQLGKTQARHAWQEMIHSSSKLLKNKLDIPFQEIAMFNPSLTQETLFKISRAVEQVVISVACDSDKLLKTAKQIGGALIISGIIFVIGRYYSPPSR